MAAPAQGWAVIIEIRAQLFQVGNSLKAAPFRDKWHDSANLRS